MTLVIALLFFIVLGLFVVSIKPTPEQKEVDVATNAAVIEAMTTNEPVHFSAYYDGYEIYRGVAYPHGYVYTSFREKGIRHG